MTTINPDDFKDLPQFRRHKDHTVPDRVEDLPGIVPEPERDMGHVIPHKTDHWTIIKRMKDRGGEAAIVEMECVGCQIKAHFKVYVALFDPDMKWLCDTCQDVRGFRWASTVTQEEYIEYQQVKTFNDDSLLRHLSKVPSGHQEAIHRPIDLGDGLRKVKKRNLD